MRKREKKIAYFLFWLLAIARERKYKNSFHYNKWDQNEIYIYIYIFHLMAIFYILCSFILSYFVHVSFFALLWYISMLHSKEKKKASHRGILLSIHNRWCAKQRSRSANMRSSHMWLSSRFFLRRSKSCEYKHMKMQHKKKWPIAKKTV